MSSNTLTSSRGTLLIHTILTISSTNTQIYSVQSYHLVTEYGGKYSLHNFALKAHKYILKGHIRISQWLQLVKLIFVQLIEAVEYIHSENICHFDISLQNIIIKGVKFKYKKEWNGQETMHLCYEKESVCVKLIDFGLAKQMNPDSKFKSTHFVGKLNYHSPEIFNRSKPFDAKKNDIWTIGVCLFMLGTGLYLCFA